MRPVRFATAVAVGAALLLAAGCSSSDDNSISDASSVGSSVGSSATQATTQEPGDAEATVPPASDGPDTSTATTGTEPAATTVPAETPTTVGEPAPLVDPSVELFEIGQFDGPVEIVARPSDTRLFIVEQGGVVRAVDDESDEVVLDVSDLVSTGNEQGLLGLAFHPSADLAYVDYTDRSGDTMVAEYAVDPATGVFDPASAREVIAVDQPYENHNGGKLVFGPDGLLYVGLGDGGSGGDPERNALDLATPLGKILRIDPAASATDSYTVPADNPFVGVDGADERIWSLGLRNPWRFTFDSATGDLWIADVGQNEFEEINHVPAVGGRDAGRGESFGWSALEGNEVFNADQPVEGQTAPVYVYSHADGGCSVSGGAVARDTTVPDLAGWYVFGDYCSGDIWGFDPASTPDAPRVVPLANLPGLAAVSIGPDGELYAISNSGEIARFVSP